MLGELTKEIRNWIREDGTKQLVQAYVRTCVQKKRLPATDDEDATRYLQADAWDLFPLPDRELSLGEKCTILAVIHDHNSTYGLINPWQSLSRTLKSEDKERRFEFGRMASAEDHGESETCIDDADSRSEHQLAVMYFTLGEGLNRLNEDHLNDLDELLEDVRRSTQSSIDTNEWNSAEESPPKQFNHGPLTGTKKQLAIWTSPGTNAHDPRTLDRRLRDGVFWGRKNSGQSFSIWFKTSSRYAEGNQQRLRDS